MENTIYYDIYDSTSFVERVSDKNFALYYILNNFIKSHYESVCHFDIVKKIADKYICLEYVTIHEKKIVKINKYNKHITIYSPYDLELFHLTELSLLYQLFYDSQPHIQNIETKQNTIIMKAPPAPILINDKGDIKSNDNTPSNNTLNNSKLTNNDKYSSPKKLPEEFLKEDLDNMKDLLEKLKTEKTEFIEIHKEIEEKFLDIDSNKRYEEKLINKEKEKDKEKYNIFKSDIQIYEKLTHEKNFSENFLPPLFEAKYYILKFLYTNDYFLDENKENPSEELYELYRTIYDYTNGKLNDEHDILETFNDLFTEFNDFLPKNKNILTDKQIMDTLNEKSEKTEIFKNDSTVDVLLATSDIDTESDGEDE